MYYKEKCKVVSLNLAHPVENVIKVVVWSLTWVDNNR